MALKVFGSIRRRNREMNPCSGVLWLVIKGIRQGKIQTGSPNFDDPWSGRGSTNLSVS